MKNILSLRKFNSSSNIQIGDIPDELGQRVWNATIKKYKFSIDTYYLSKTRAIIKKIQPLFIQYQEMLIEIDKKNFVKKFYYMSETRIKLIKLSVIYHFLFKEYPNYFVIDIEGILNRNILNKQRLIDAIFSRGIENEKKNELVKYPVFFDKEFFLEESFNLTENLHFAPIFSSTPNDLEDSIESIENIICCIEGTEQGQDVSIISRSEKSLSRSKSKKKNFSRRGTFKKCLKYLEEIEKIHEDIKENPHLPNEIIENENSFHCKKMKEDLIQFFHMKKERTFVKTRTFLQNRKTKENMLNAFDTNKNKLMKLISQSNINQTSKKEKRKIFKLPSIVQDNPITIRDQLMLKHKIFKKKMVVTKDISFFDKKILSIKKLTPKKSFSNTTDTSSIKFHSNTLSDSLWIKQNNHKKTHRFFLKK